jgi:hypothetical protein
MGDSFSAGLDRQLGAKGSFPNLFCFVIEGEKEYINHIESKAIGPVPPGPGDEKMNDNRERRYPMGDKGKKDKDKGQKQKINKQDQITKNKLAKQPKRKP